MVKVAGSCVHVPRNGKTAVIVTAVNAVTVIPVVHIHAHLAVGVEVEAYHGILASLVNARFVVTGYGVAQRTVHVGFIVKLLLPLLQTVLTATADGLAVNGDVAVLLREVVVTLLCE